MNLAFALTSLLFVSPNLSLAAADEPVSVVRADDQTTGTITITVTGFSSDYGQALLYLYNDSSGFPTKPARAWRSFKTPINGGKATFTLPNLAVREYAAFAVHDYNANNKLDTNWLGIPKEGVAASNNAKGRMGPPRYRKAKFSLTPAGIRQVLKLVYI